MQNLENKKQKKKEKQLWMMEILLCLIQHVFIINYVTGTYAEALKLSRTDKISAHLNLHSIGDYRKQNKNNS